MKVAGRAFVAGLLGGAVAGAVTAPLSLAVIVVIELVAPGPDPALGTTPAPDSDSAASGDDSVALGVIQLILAMLNLSILGGLVGLVVGLVVALPVAPVVALAAPWLAGRPEQARLVCACAYGLAAAAFETAIVAVSGGEDWGRSFFANPLFLVPPLVIALIVGYRYGPRLIDGAPEPPQPSEGTGPSPASAPGPDATGHDRAGRSGEDLGPPE
ncbi:hypothetical protein HS041_31530 [Planomonospora sp. ID67723]|uniref:hypothetical protein n=1 Tax=Planomonospora sp. ID67723 TaxID=2738134 RepID=UPI0018C41BF9|nr:hypothetical protein [Planomonospora sp. ID67723]MBG0832241.1 hypothetical protein [Planomonospora sp. ID67723]